MASGDSRAAISSRVHLSEMSRAAFASWVSSYALHVFGNLQLYIADRGGI